jgi:hypothetical protein
MWVSTKLTMMRRASSLLPSTTTYAKAAVANIGYETIVSPYWPHAVLVWVCECFPHSFAVKVRFFFLVLLSSEDGFVTNFPNFKL